MKNQQENYKFFQHRECEYFPCHKGVKEEDFNCLFCYCPLYMLGRECGGNYQYLESGIKSCENCPRPHIRGNYNQIVAKYKDIVHKMQDMEPNTSTNE